MTKKYPNILRIIVVLAFVVSLVAVVAGPAGAAVNVNLDSAHYANGQTVTVTVFNAAFFSNGINGQTMNQTVTSSLGDTESVTLTENADTGLVSGTITVASSAAATLGNGIMEVALRGTISTAFGPETTTADIVELTIDRGFYKIG